LENIFYDEEKDKIIFIDFASSLNFDGEFISFVGSHWAEEGLFNCHSPKH
jgi:hypothetical protein